MAGPTRAPSSGGARPGARRAPVPGAAARPDPERSADAHDPSGWRRRRERGRRRSIFWRLRRPLFLVGLAVLAVVAGVGVMLARTELPEFKHLDQASLICAVDVAAGQCTADNAMARLQSDDGNRTNIRLDDLPPIVVQAVLAVEDRKFYEHDGVNPEGIVRALFQNVRSRSVQQGGSTITQQYVLNSFSLSREGGISRKLKEAVLSIKLEQQMSKDEIIEGYLNTVFFGRGAYGVGAASRAYFGIDARFMTDPGQAALLAGLIRAPAAAEPSKDPEEATRRRHTALVAMEEEGYITPEQREAADAVPVAEPWVKPLSTVKLVDTLRGAADDDYMGTDYLPAYIERELQGLDPRFTPEVIRGGGLRVYTSLNYDLQRAAWQAVTTTLDREEDPEAALVAVDQEGLVRAMVGSRHHFTPGTYESNYALRGFQPGSTFKPVVLAEAIREGYSLRSRYDARGTMEFGPEITGGDPWKVSNYSESDAGVMDLVEATAQSSNTAYAQLMLDLGTDFSVDKDGDGTPETARGPAAVATLAESMGIGGSDGIPDHQETPAMVLGTVDATPLEMAGAYSTFANRGVYTSPDIITRVEQVDDEGVSTVLYQRQATSTRILSESQSDLVTHALRGVIDGGTGEGAAIGRPAAGKTGTAQENRASWFSGYVPGLTATVWMGYPNAGDGTGWDDPDTPEFDDEIWPMNESGRLVHGRPATGGSFPAEMWRKFMEQAAAGLTGEFVEPSPEAIGGGVVLNEDELRTADETTTVLPPWPGGGGPGWSLPGITRPTAPGGRGGGGGGGTPDPTDAPASTDTTAPDVPDTSEPVVPPIPVAGGSP